MLKDSKRLSSLAVLIEGKEESSAMTVTVYCISVYFRVLTICLESFLFLSSLTSFFLHCHIVRFHRMI